MVLEPVQRERTVYRFDGAAASTCCSRTGSGRVGPLPAGQGLLVWHVDPERAELGAWNTDERRAAVSLVQADGRNDLGAAAARRRRRPVPGPHRRDWFRSHMGGGIQLTGIEVASRSGPCRRTS
jgi:hypothetical protein